MNMKNILVPAYVADEFNLPLRHPSKKLDAVDVSVERVYRLMNEALKELKWPDWEIAGTQYCSIKDVEPYGFERVDDKFYIYAKERGRRSSVAIFKSYHMAANYFVWLVSKGKKEIDWELFLDMVP